MPVIHGRQYCPRGWTPDGTTHGFVRRTAGKAYSCDACMVDFYKSDIFVYKMEGQSWEFSWQGNIPGICIECWATEHRQTAMSRNSSTSWPRRAGKREPKRLGTYISGLAL